MTFTETPTTTDLALAYALTAEAEDHGDLAHHSEAHRYVSESDVHHAWDSVIVGYGGDHRMVLSYGVDDPQ